MSFTQWTPWSCYGSDYVAGETEIAVAPPRGQIESESHLDAMIFGRGNQGNLLSAPSYTRQVKRPHALRTRPDAVETVSCYDGFRAVHGDFEPADSPTTVASPGTAKSWGTRDRAWSEFDLPEEVVGSRKRAWSDSSRATTAGSDVQFNRSEMSVADAIFGPAVLSDVRRTQSEFVGGSSGHLGEAVQPMPTDPVGLAASSSRNSSQPLRIGLEAKKQGERNQLDTLIAVGDVIAVRGSDRISRIGASGGFMGHVLIVTSPPKGINRDSAEALDFMRIWPGSGSVRQIWQIAALESVRQTTGLHAIDLLCYVEDTTGKIVLLGEVGEQTILKYEHANDVPELLEVWQCPQELRAANRLDLMEEVLSDMKAEEGTWSWSTAVRAFLLPSGVMSSNSARMPTLQEIQDCWKVEPICTSVVIAFWQRYLCKLAHRGYPFTTMTAMDLILKWMPLKADRVLPGELLAALRQCQWGHIERLHPTHRFKHLEQLDPSAFSPPRRAEEM